MAETKDDIKQTEESGDRSLDDLGALKLDQNGYPLRPQPSDDPLGKRILSNIWTYTSNLRLQIRSIGTSGSNWES